MHSCPLVTAVRRQPASRLCCVRLRTLAGCTLTWLGLAVGALTQLRAESAANPGWQDLREWRFTEAAHSFERGVDEPASRLGHAVALLNLQPRTADRLAQAEQELTALTEDASVNSDLAVAARYLLARIAEVHAFPQNPARAADLYAALLASHPRDPLTQAAAARLATLRLYRLGSDPLSTLASLEPFAQQLTEAGARRDFHLVMGRSYLFFGGERRRALDHLQAALAAGIVAPTVRADLLVQIGELARDLNQPGISPRVWSEFVATYPRDPRVDLVRQRLGALKAEAVP